MGTNANWLLFNDSMKEEWCQETTRLLQRVLGVQDVKVALRLPTKEEAKRAFVHNVDLTGSLTILVSGKASLELNLPLPYDGVFLMSRSDDKEAFNASTMVWHSWLGEKPGFRFVKTPSGDVCWRVGLPGGQFIGRKIGKERNKEKPQSGRKNSLGLEWLKVFGTSYLGWKPDSDWLEAKNWEAMHDIACRIYEQGKEVDAEDLEHRMLLTFPVWLRIRLCQRLWRWRDLWGKNEKVLKNLLERTLIPFSSLTSRNNQKVAAETGIVYVEPNNAVELCARLTHVSRYKLPHDQLERKSANSRQNHNSFNGRLCPLESPESELVGLSLQLASGATVNVDGSINPAPDVGSGYLEKLGMGAALVPFAPYNDGVRMMMGAKNLRQTVPIQGREVPCVRTGGEKRIEALTNNLVDIGICPCTHQGEGVDRHLALGRDLLVAYLPWYGWNVDDAVVVGKHVVDEGWFTTTKSKHFRRRVKNNCRVVSIAAEGTELTTGSVIAELTTTDGRKTSPIKIVYQDAEPATLKHIKCSIPKLDLLKPISLDKWARSYSIEYEIEKQISLGVGDKLMGRHGNKGVVGRVEEHMPTLQDGTPIDILLNPHGVISRMNLGQLLETHIGWLLKHGINTEKLVKDGAYSDKIGYPDRTLINHGEVQNELEKSGLDKLGRMKLKLPQTDGHACETSEPVVVGYEHIVRLCHIPGLKAQARRGGGGKDYYASKTGQAAHGRRVGGGQRLGEMEVWALNAYNADHILEELLGSKSDALLAKEWVPGNEPPTGDFWSGFPHILRDWLFALLIDLKFDEKQRRLSLSLLADKNKLPAPTNTKETNRGKVQSESIENEPVINDEMIRQLSISLSSDKNDPKIGAAVKQRIEPGDGHDKQVINGEMTHRAFRAQYHCEKCEEGNPFADKKFLVTGRENSKVLKVASFLEAFGLRVDGVVEPRGKSTSSGGLVHIKRITDREDDDLNRGYEFNVVCLPSKKKGCDEESDSVYLELSPLDANEIDCWPKGFTLRCKGRYSSNKIKVYPSEIWKAITTQDGNYKLEDFIVTCAGKHGSQPLKLKEETREEEFVTAEGSLWSHSIFGQECFVKPEDEEWGYIELPFDMEYPIEAFIDGKYINLAAKGETRTDDETKAYDSFVESCPNLKEELESRACRIRIIPVLPFHYRANIVRDELRDRLGAEGYVPLLRACKAYELAREHEKGKIAQRIRACVINLFKLLIDELDGKMGLLRREGLGRRVDRSARLVIAPNPDLDWNQIGIPAAVLWELIGDKVLAWANDESIQGDWISQLKARNTAKYVSGWSWNRSCHTQDDLAKIYEILKLYLHSHSDELVLLNRQPSLHRDSMRAFHPVPIPHEEGYALRISPLVCKGFGADFDGDEMVVHYPVSPKAQDDARELLPEANLLSMADGKPMVSYSQDFVMGTYLNPRRTFGCAFDDLKKDKDSVGRSVGETNSGMVELERMCGLLAKQNIATPISEEKLKELFGGVRDDGTLVARFVHEWMQKAFAECTNAGVSFGFYDFRALSGQVNHDRCCEDGGAALCEALCEKIKHNPNTTVSAGASIARMVCSGARGKKQIEQLVNRRGILDGMDKCCCIDTSIVEGMDWKQTFDAAKNARSSMCDKKLNTAKAGALTRRFVMALWSVKIVMEDCGSDATNRSVLTCKAHGGVCARCYGLLPNGELPPIGYPAGLIAAQSIGERGTQLSMQSFHSGDRRTMSFSKLHRLFAGSDYAEERLASFDVFKKSLKGDKTDGTDTMYYELDDRHLELLYRALKGAVGRKLDNVVTIENDGFLSWLVVRLADDVSHCQSAQMKRLLAGALGDCAADALTSPVAKVLFDLWGGRNDIVISRNKV